MKNKKINLEKKYLYLPLLTRNHNKPKNIFQIMEQIDKKSLLEEVAAYDIALQKKRKDLREWKVKAVKQIILNQQEVPENWILKPDYQSILTEAMQDPVVLQYAIINKDYHLKKTYPEKSLEISRSVDFMRRRQERIDEIKEKIMLRKKKSLENIKRERNTKNHLDTGTKNEFLLTALKTEDPTLPKIQTRILEDVY